MTDEGEGEGERARPKETDKSRNQASPHCAQPLLEQGTRNRARCWRKERCCGHGPECARFCVELTWGAGSAIGDSIESGKSKEGEGVLESVTTS